MKEAGFEFSVEKPDVEETWPEHLAVDEVPRYLAMKKAEFFRMKMADEIVVAADTVVILNGNIMNKPIDRADALHMLGQLSGRTHRVITGVSIISKEKEESFDDTTFVTFQALTKEEIEFYVDNYKPFDKAGAYGAQDWIGMVGVKRIEGSYFTVMGLPIHLVYQHLKSW